MPFESYAGQPIKVQRYSWETPLQVLCFIFAFFAWIFIIFSIFGAVYAVLIGIFLLFAHVSFIAYIRGNGVKLGPDQFPELYQAVQNLSRRMEMPEPEVYLMQAGGALNAMATKFMRSNMMVLYSDLIEACGENHAARDMIIAHELGHLKEGHLKWFWFLVPAYFFPILGTGLSRAREYTCDRYGLAGAGDLSGALLGLAILAAGGKYAKRVNMQTMASQVKNLNTGWMTIGEWLTTHPPLAKRMIAMDPALKPRENYTQKGIIRAIFIFFCFYLIPVFLFTALFTFLVLKDVQKQMQLRKGIYKQGAYYQHSSLEDADEEEQVENQNPPAGELSFKPLGIKECDDFFKKSLQCLKKKEAAGEFSSGDIIFFRNTLNYQYQSIEQFKKTYDSSAIAKSCVQMERNTQSINPQFHCED